jgi:hypothetical protein
MGRGRAERMAPAHRGARRVDDPRSRTRPRERAVTTLNPARIAARIDLGGVSGDQDRDSGGGDCSHHPPREGAAVLRGEASATSIAENQLACQAPIASAFGARAKSRVKKTLAQTSRPGGRVILVALTHDVSNARTEGFNRVIKTTKRGSLTGPRRGNRRSLRFPGEGWQRGGSDSPSRPARRRQQRATTFR